ncbi:hypothetical protein ACXWRS_12110, partial [Streptococcus pyogenes]
SPFLPSPLFSFPSPSSPPFLSFLFFSLLFPPFSPSFFFFPPSLSFPSLFLFFSPFSSSSPFFSSPFPFFSFFSLLFF